MYGDQTILYVTTMESPVHTDLPKPHRIYKAGEKPNVKDERFSLSYCGFADSNTVMCLLTMCWKLGAGYLSVGREFTNHLHFPVHLSS